MYELHDNEQYFFIQNQSAGVFFPNYQTVQQCEKNEIKFFSNLNNDVIKKLLKA